MSRRERIAAALGIGALLILGPQGAQPTSAQILLENLDVTDGLVTSVARGGNTIYIAGDFTRVGPRTGGGAALDPTTSVAWGTPFVRGNVYAAASDGAGGFYIGGEFTDVGGLPRANLARILADHSVSSWDPGADGAVRALVVSGSTVFAGGDFANAGGAARSQLAALDSSTGAPASWNPGANAPVFALAINGNTLYVGGAFTFIAGSGTRQFMSAIDATTGAPIGWGGQDPNGPVFAIAFDATNVYIGGVFITVGASPRNYIAALNPATGSPRPWNPNASAPVFALSVGGGVVYAGGDFTSMGFVNRLFVAALDPVTGFPTSWDPQALNAAVYALAIEGTTVYVGGDFVDGTFGLWKGIVGFDAATGLPTGWSPKANGSVHAIAATSAAVFAGGDFAFIGGEFRNGIAALDATTGSLTSWNPAIVNAADDLEVSGSMLLVAGAFVDANPFRVGVAAFDRDSALPVWETDVTPSEGGAWVHSISLKPGGGPLYIGGEFSEVGGAARDRLAALDPATGAVNAWNPGASLTVYDVEVGGSTVYVAGAFQQVGGISRIQTAAIDESGTVLAWDPSTEGGVFDLEVSGSTVYAGGVFANMGGAPRNNIAALDASSGAALPWAPNPDATVYELALGAGDVYICGAFANVGGQPRSRLAAVDAVTGDATSWDPSPDAEVYAVRCDGFAVYAGGVFNTIDGQERPSFAGFEIEPSTVTIAASAGPGGVIDPTGSVSVDRGANQAFTITPDACHSILDVLVDGSSIGAVTDYTFTDVQANHTISASFTIQPYALTTAVIGGGILLITPDQPSYDCGVSVEIAAQASAGWQFEQWTGDASGNDNPLAVVMNGNKSITAVFIDVAPPEVGLISPNGGEVWFIGSTHAITWTASDNAGVTAVDLAYSVDGGATYPNIIATGLANSGSYDWTVPNTATVEARVQVTAHDAVAQSASAASNANFEIQSDPTTVGEVLLAEGEMIGVYPNPASAGVANVIYRIPGAAKVELNIFDITGRKVRTFEAGISGENIGRLAWDGRDEHGQSLSPGVYFVRLAADSGLRATKRIVLLR